MLKKMNAFYRQRPVYVKISMLHCAIICVVVALLVIAISQIASGILIEQKTENCAKDLIAISEKMDMLFGGYERDAQAIIKNQRYQDMLLLEEGASKSESALRALNIAIALADFRSAYTKINKIRFYDVVYQTIIDNYLESPDRYVPSSWADVNAFIDTQDTYRWTDFAVAAPGNAYISLLRRVNNYSGRFIGVLELTVSELQIRQMYRHYESDDMRFFLLNPDGQIVSGSNEERLGEQLVARDRFSSVIANVGGRMRLDIDGESSLVVSKINEKLGYWLVGVVSYASIVWDVNRLVWAIILIGVAGILTASVLVRWTAKRSTYPLERIISVIDSVGHGSYSARVELQAGDEFQALGVQLNEMIDNMVGMMALIRNQSEQKRMYELKNLQMQMNPHFLYNSLETVCGIIESGDDRLAIRMVNDISRFYRGVLSGGSSMVPISQEIQITRRYLEIVKTRYRDSFDLRVKIQPEMLPMEIPKLILQPLVENSVVHGFIGKRAHARLMIHGKIQDGRRIICISDNGCGIPPDKLGKIMAGEYPRHYSGGGFGFRSIDERIKLVFGSDYGLRVWSVYGVGTRMSIVLPLDGREAQP